MNRFAVILAGGGGTRFWPLSRKNKPKQFLKLNGKNAMINDTIMRYESVIPFENTFIVTNIKQARILEDILIQSVPKANILKEPEAKNTAACILYSAMHIMKKHGDSVICILPSDHFISKTEKFRDILNQAFNYAENNEKIVTIGIQPTFPSTGYGYINCGKRISDDFLDVTEFVEKPSYDKALYYYNSNNFLWNSGMFIWKTSTIIKGFERYLPKLYQKLNSIYDYIGTDLEYKKLSEVYSSLQSISVDYGILERSNDVVVIPGDIGWSDVGSWDSLGELYPPNECGNIIKAPHVCLDTNNSIIYGNKRLIATVGVKDLIIADTEDALLVCPKEMAQEVSKVVDTLKITNMHEYL